MKQTIWLSAIVSAVLLSGCAGSSQPVSTPDIKNEIESGAKVSYLGPAGTYTEEAAQFFFPDAGEMRPQKTVEEAIAEAADGQADYAVIPQENTVGGAVIAYVDALIKEQRIHVVGEVILPISQTLMGVPGAKLSDIQTVCSHTQGLSQSETWRREHLPNADVKEMPSTAAAAEYVAQQKDRTIAAVAAPGAAKLYGLDVLAENVQITMANKTRFYVLARGKLPDSGHSRAVFVADCRADRLDDLLITIHNSGLELETVHDRPEGNELGAYSYIIEVKNEAGITEKQIQTVEKEEGVRFLGSFAVREKNVQ